MKHQQRQRQLPDVNPYPLNVKDLGSVQLPRLGRKKKAIHSKNPFKVKKTVYIDEDKLPRRRLDGFFLLKQTKNDLPHEIIKATLSKMRISEVCIEDMRYFINLVDLDLSENQIKLQDLINFVNLVSLNLSANNLVNFFLNENQTFANLENLNLSYNQVNYENISQLATIPKLRILNLESNELKQLPEDMSIFLNLEEFNLSENNFESDQNVSTLWFSLASIKKLKILRLARNYLRGIHTEKLIAGNFMNLELLDFSYNQVENQHNLICTRNFRNLKQLIITGNPFAIIKEHKGLEMEVFARIGAEVVNEEIEKFYLKNKQNKKKPNIKYDQFVIIENDNFDKEKNFFMGVEMPKNLQFDQQQIKEGEEQPQSVEDREKEMIQAQIRMSSEDEAPAAEEEVMFITEDPNQKQKQKSSTQQQRSQQDSRQAALQPKESKDSLQKLSQQNHSIGYEDFIEIARDQLGDNKEYDQHFDLNTAYKTLKNAIKKPDSFDYKDFQEPHYLKATATIKRYKPQDHSSQLISAESIEKADAKRKNQSQQSSQKLNEQTNENEVQQDGINNNDREAGEVKEEDEGDVNLKGLF